jgi:hypothetical protein
MGWHMRLRTLFVAMTIFAERSLMPEHGFAPLIGWW